jgi:hypothetical protein
MLATSIKSKSLLKDDFYKRVFMNVNSKSDIIRVKSKQDPTARGARKYK